MAVKASGRFVPPSAFAAGTGKAFIRVDLAQNGIRPQRWELEALARGATVNYDGEKFTYPVADEWPGFSTNI